MENKQFQVLSYTEKEDRIQRQGDLETLGYILTKHWGNLETEEDIMGFLGLNSLKQYKKEGRSVSMTCRQMLISHEMQWVQFDIIIGDTMLLTIRQIHIREEEVLQVLMNQMLFKKPDIYMSTEEQEQEFLLGMAGEEAKRDFLTKLYNRNAMNALINAQLEKNNQNAAIILIDLDNFGVINNYYGHRTGEHVLQAVAENVWNLVTSADIVGRIGGDEFIVFLSQPSSGEGQDREEIISNVCRLIQKSLEQILFGFQLTCSIGISCYPYDGKDYNTLVEAADKALYYAKERGKNQFAFFKEI